MPASEKVNYKKISKKALKLFDEKQFDKALPLFEQVAEQNLNSDDWFNVATCAILCKQIDKGHEALNKAIELYKQIGNDENLPIGQMCFYFMHALNDVAEYDLGFAQLEQFKQTIIDLKITDDHFLYIRGIPFLGNILNASVNILQNQTKVKALDWLNDFAAKVDSEGKVLIEDFIKTNGFA